MIDRTEINRALAKALAFADVGDHEKAASWGFDVIHALDKAGILNACMRDQHSLIVERPLRARRA